jgi:hypothetical protein
LRLSRAAADRSAVERQPHCFPSPACPGRPSQAGWELQGCRSQLLDLVG